MFIKSRFFWLSTALFLVLGLGIIWKIYPPLLSQARQNKTQNTDLTAQVNQAQQYLTLVKQLSSDTTTVDSLYSSAAVALPASADTENLLLQLDGLLASLKLSNVSITAPISQVVSTTSPAAPTSGTAVPQTQTGSSTTTPVVNSDAKSQSTFTLSGEMSYGSALQLVQKLRTFARWNKITVIDITQTGGKTTATITAQVFSKAAPTSDFSGSDNQFITKAKNLFSQYQSYASVPDATKEGSYGRSDPFAGL